jgi:aminocarboxymuconate-semialdehyde decarboxylase
MHASLAEATMRIDVHAHLFPTEYLQLLSRLGGAAGPGFISQLGGGSSAAELEARFAMMDRAGVDREILSVSFSVPATTDEPKAVEAARCVNDAYSDLVRRHPTRFSAFATVPLPFVDAAISEIGRALDQLGMVGVATTTEILGVPLADPSFDRFFAQLDRRRAVLFIHPSGSSVHSAPMQDFTWSIGAPVEDMLCLLQLVKADIPKRFPRLRIISAHLGGCTPFLMERLSHHDVLPESYGPVRPALTEAEAKWFYYDTVNGHPPALRCARDTFGADRLLMGTDVPFNRGDGHQKMVEHVAQAGLPDGEVAAIYSGNALRLFGGRLA